MSMTELTTVTGTSSAPIINVKVDAFPVQRLLDLVMHAVSPGSLLDFLEERVVLHFHEDIDLRFAYEGDRKSGNWPALRDSTNDIREALGFPPVTPINIRTGELHDFVTNHFEAHLLGEGAAVDIPGEPTDPELRNKLLTAQQGSDNNPPFRATPARPVLAADETDMEEILIMLQEHVMMEVLVGGLHG